MVAAVNFGKISTATVDEDGNKVDYKLNIDQNLEVKFACWERANTYSWGTKKVNNKQVSAKPSIMWNADGNIIISSCLLTLTLRTAMILTASAAH